MKSDNLYSWTCQQLPIYVCVYFMSNKGINNFLFLHTFVDAIVSFLSLPHGCLLSLQSLL